MHNIIVRFASFPPQLKQINQDHIKISFIEENAQCLRAKSYTQHSTSHRLNAFYFLSRSLRRCFTFSQLNVLPLRKKFINIAIGPEAIQKSLCR